MFVLEFREIESWYQLSTVRDYRQSSDTVTLYKCLNNWDFRFWNLLNNKRNNKFDMTTTSHTKDNILKHLFRVTYFVLILTYVTRNSRFYETRFSLDTSSFSAASVTLIECGFLILLGLKRGTQGQKQTGATWQHSINPNV